MERHRRLSLPTGTETLHLREAARHRAITRSLEDLYADWGYLPAETPLVDYFDVYRPYISERVVRSMYRAVDRQGEILALRSDTTLFLARQLGLHLTHDDLPVRVCYSDQIVRAEDANGVSNNEFQQAGIELVGPAGSDADAEVILLALESMHALGISDGVIHVGYRPLAAALLATDDPAALETAMRQLHFRRGLTDGDPLVADDRARRALATIGPVETLDSVAPAVNGNPHGQQALDDFRTTLDTVARHAPSQGPRLRVDLSEVGTNEYYTGIALSGYLPDSNDAVVLGGRYDRLLAAFGFDAPSCGFAVYTRKLPQRVAREIAAAQGEPNLPDALADRIAAIRANRSVSS